MPGLTWQQGAANTRDVAVQYLWTFHKPVIVHECQPLNTSPACHLMGDTNCNLVIQYGHPILM
jgi:hypothetical protein